MVSNATHTLFSYSTKRGEEGIKASQVLTKFSGNLVDDLWEAYDLLECTHSRCNARLLCELTACVEDGHLCAKNVITALLATKQAVDQARANGEKVIDPALGARLQNPYDHWVDIGLKAHPEQHKLPNKQGKPGRVKQSTHSRQVKAKMPDSMGDLRVRLSLTTCLGSGVKAASSARQPDLIIRTARRS